jgi:hypothetical protein
MIPDKIYNVLKWIAIVALPALATLVKVVCAIWKLPYGDQIATTITAVATFLGALLAVSTGIYNKKNKEIK